MLRNAPIIVTRSSRKTWKVSHIRPRSRCNSNITAIRNDEPLRILFCGSDDFSSSCLNALCEYQRSPGSNIGSIHVATRTDKLTGRGRTTVTAPPLKTHALKLGLSVHQFDTFTGWNLPKLNGHDFINMVIAVSFGLLVPPRILNACQFGGLNVHPSLLPDLKGSAPIQHAILYGYEWTGVSVQRLHPSKFDEGQVLLQELFQIRNHQDIKYRDLHDQLAALGARNLVEVLKQRLYLMPENSYQREEPAHVKTATKLSPQSRQVNFEKMSSVTVTRMFRALDKLWFAIVGKTQKGTSGDLRMILNQDIRVANLPDDNVPASMLEEVKTGIPFKITAEGKHPAGQEQLYVRCADGKYICFSEAIVSGYSSDNAAILAKKADLFDPNSVINHGKITIHPFREEALKPNSGSG